MNGASKRVVVIGGGASGVMFCSHLLQKGGGGCSVTLVEKRSSIGLGAAYSTDHPDHLLNVRAANMSAYPDDPDHFVRWLAADPLERWSAHAGGGRFVARRTYGRYLKSLVAQYIGEPSQAARMRVISGRVTAITNTAAGVVVGLADGAELAADVAVLCTGFDEPTDQMGPYSSAWSRPANIGLAPRDAVLVLGTGLTMVDVVVSLRSGGHAGPIVALSRRGLLPHSHVGSGGAQAPAEKAPIGASVVTIMRWLRREARSVMSSGGDWRSTIDGIRPFTTELWHHMPLSSKRRFLRHARAWWDIHRHRMAPVVAREIEAAMASEQLRIVAGRVIQIEHQGDKALVTYQPRGESEIASALFSRIINCSGMHTEPTRPENPLMQSLLAQGVARVDPLGIGLEIASDLAVVSECGIASDRIFALGPLTRASFWESTAVPDIRQQCHQLASRLAQLLQDAR